MRPAGRPRSTMARWIGRPSCIPTSPLSRSFSPPQPEEGFHLPNQVQRLEDGFAASKAGKGETPPVPAGRPTAVMKPIHSQVRIGHVHLKVADLERSLEFFRDVLGGRRDRTRRTGGPDAGCRRGCRRSEHTPFDGRVRWPALAPAGRSLRALFRSGTSPG